jgi:hypothetical protein
MIADPAERGRRLAEFFEEVAPRLWDDIVETGLLPDAPNDAAVFRARIEWECFALYACVRGLVAAGGFNRETGAAVDAMHEAVLEQWMTGAADLDAFQARRALVSERYAEYGAIGQEGGAASAGTVADRLGRAAARHIVPGSTPSPDLAELVGGLHETLAEGAAEAVRLADQ